MDISEINIMTNLRNPGIEKIKLTVNTYVLLTKAQIDVLKKEQKKKSKKG